MAAISSTADRTSSWTRIGGVTGRIETAIRSLPGGVRADSTNGRSGGGAASRSPWTGPATTSSHRAVSSTRRLTHPATLSPYQCSGSGARDTRPRWVLSPNRPQQPAGMRIEPPPSDAYAAPTRPAATAAADPPLDPPGLNPCFHGLCVTPNASDSVNGKIASSGICVRPTITAPAARSRRTTSASAVAGRSNAREP